MRAQSNAEEQKGSEEDLLNPDKGLMRFEFVEAIIRIVVIKYMKTGQCTSFAAAYERLMTEHVLLHAPPVLKTNDLFRRYDSRALMTFCRRQLTCARSMCRDLLYTKDVNEVFKPAIADLKYVFFSRCQQKQMGRVRGPTCVNAGFCVA